MQGSSNRSVAITTTSSELAPQVIGAVRRTQIIITNTSGTTLTVNKNDTQAAVAGTGILLSQNQSYIESDDGGFRCWQGAWQAVGSANSTVSVVETFETP